MLPVFKRVPAVIHLSFLIFRTVWDKLHDVRHVAMQGVAYPAEDFRRDVLALAQLGKR